MVWSTDSEGNFDYMSRSWMEYTGLSLEETRFEEALRRVVHPEDFQPMMERWVQARESGGPFQAELRLRRASDGAYRWFLSRSVPLRDERGRVVHRLGATTDIEEQKRAEEVLRESDRRKSEFLATLGHELRNPLAPIRTSLHVLRATNEASVRQWVLEIMERQVEHMVRLIDDLLDVSRIGRGRIELRMEMLDLVDVVRRAVETARPLIHAARHELTLRLPSQALTMKADAMRLTQVFANLLNNAAKYTEEGGRIWLSVERWGGEALVSVRDNGIGIAAEHLPRVFEMFTQVSTATERSQGGLGIGLALVRSLSEMHGGSVQARSDGLGRGSEFTVRLPLVADEPVPRAPRAAEGGPAATRAAKRRILVADDNRDSADSLATMLRMAGHAVCTAHGGAAALEVAEAFRPDIALLDIGMPKLDGYEVARRIRMQPWGHALLLIATTGWSAEEDKRQALQAGFDLHMTKPVDVAVLDKLLAGRRRPRRETSPGGS